MKHPLIRKAVLDALKAGNAQAVTWFDGRPSVLDAQDLPAVAVYLTDAESSDESVDEDMWRATLHIEVFLKGDDTDSALDEWMENNIYPVMASIPTLSGVLETMSARGYDYQRDDELATWGSADLQYSVSYVM
ncbi:MULTISPECIES: phage tail terminator protein [Atlantibacter]|uniref:Putative minor tail protein U n=1 Tax=Atlantibacter hermannii NBRC 105704 TaxID=1115512 RepID=H5UYW3_ATLHE|nr:MULTISPECIES: phage tail terminator protein [Atlantibacter]QPS90069.1 phage tail protein [Atlantibacter hermannii]GAB50117.1 putative minor tail protein U [Atlantibacter hermannii NBRC 105704]VDZ73123.1 Minor tail protein U [Atlantibacter hermannii]HAP82928.1 phage tail protein [Enterobacteriaceae bacterium]